MRIVPDLMGRLFAQAGQGSEGGLLYLSVDQAREAVSADLEALLNSRSGLSQTDLEDFPLTKDSVLNFGVPDFSALSLSSSIDRDKVCQNIVRVVEKFDRRLNLVDVQIDAENQKVGQLRFSISAVLTLEGQQESVHFNAEFEPRTQKYVVARRTVKAVR